MLKAISLLGIGFASIFLVSFLGAYHSSHSVRATNFNVTSKGQLFHFYNYANLLITAANEICKSKLIIAIELYSKGLKVITSLRMVKVSSNNELCCMNYCDDSMM